jgi:hypothetical protein
MWVVAGGRSYRVTVKWVDLRRQGRMLIKVKIHQSLIGVHQIRGEG